MANVKNSTASDSPHRKTELTWIQRSEALIDSFSTYMRTEKGASQHTLESYRREVRFFARWLHQRGHAPELPAVRRRRIKKYLAKLLAEGKEAVSVRHALVALRSFFGFLVDDDRIAQNPAKLVRSPK